MVGARPIWARPAASPRNSTIRRGRSFCTCAPIPKGCTRNAGATLRGCGRFFNALRDTTTDHFLAFYKTGEPRPALAWAGRPSLDHRLPQAGVAHELTRPPLRRDDRLQHSARLEHGAERVADLLRRPRRSITTPALSIRRPVLRRGCRRHLGIRAAGQRRSSHGPVIQVSPATRRFWRPAPKSPTPW